MTNEERKIILKELCMRLPYVIKVLDETWNYEWDQELSLLERVTGIDEDFIYVKVIDGHTGEEYRADKHCIDLLSIKLFLRPMSSMTEEERSEYNELREDIEAKLKDRKCADFMEWIYLHHFDYRGLIEKGLALEAPEGMY